MGRKVFALQTLPPMMDERQGPELSGKVAGFSLHAGVSTKAHERAKFECFYRYISRPPVAPDRLSLAAEGNVRYTLKTPYRNGNLKEKLVACARDNYNTWREFYTQTTKLFIHAYQKRLS
jgi:hypothetical protein